MEYCESNLYEALEMMKAFFNEQACPFNTSTIGLYIKSEFFFEIVQGLNYLHNQNPIIIHRDLNPSNILVKKSKNGKNIKISDFGLSVKHEKKTIDRNLNSQSHTMGVGTLRYMAPEVQMRRRYNEKVDIFSLGLILRFMFDWSELE